MEIVAAVVSGLFSIGGAFLSHYLHVRHQSQGAAAEPESTARQSQTPPGPRDDTSRNTSPSKVRRETPSPHTGDESTLSWRVPLLLCLAVFPHTMFGFVLLDSPPDRAFGYIWFAITLAIAGGVVVSTFAFRFAPYVAFLGAGLQLLLLLGLFAFASDGLKVIPATMINAIPIIAFSLIGKYYYSTRLIA